MFLKYFNIALLLVPLISGSILSQTYVPKDGGICFRVDDNGLTSQFDEYSAVFNKYNKKFNFAMNLALNEFDSQEYIDKIISYQNMGNELMDHSPNHRTTYFTTKFDTNEYSGDQGVDHIIGNKICLKHEHPDILQSVNSGTASIKNNEIEFSNNDFDDIKKNEERYIYIQDLDTLVLVEKYHNKKATISDLWEDPISLADQSGITYYTFIRNKINLVPQAISLLANETQKLANLYGLTPPQVFIQPGGNFLDFNSYELKTPLENFGYTSAATYPNSAEKVYNEYNPTGERQFAIQWGDFVETDQDLETIKLIIADGIAKHKMMIGNVHWYSDDEEFNWNDYIEKNDSLLSWATRESIPVRTYSEWADLLYYETPEPYFNIMPPFNVDKDQNGIPDGYTNVLYPQSINGTFVIDTTTPGPGKNYYSIETDQAWNNRLTYILGLGGLEKGDNDLSVWTMGAPGDSVEIVFSEPWPSDKSISFKFPAETSDWEKQSLSKQGKSFFVADTHSVLDVDFYCSDYVSGTVKIAGLSMSKMVEIKSLEMNVLNTLPTRAGDSIYVEVIAKDEFDNPHENYFNYNLTSIGSSTAEILPSAIRSFNGNEKDTIIVVDTTAGNFSLTAALLNDPLVTVTKQINISTAKVKYLNFLTIADSITIGDTLTVQVALEDTFKNRVPDSLVTYQLLNGNGIFSNSSNNISVTTNTLGVAQDLFTASNSLTYSADSIVASYGGSINDTIILPLIAAPINKIELTVLSTLPAFDGDSIMVEIAAKDTFDNPVVYSGNYIMSAIGSNTAKFTSTSGFSFNSIEKDTLFVSDSLAGSFNISGTLENDTLITDTTNIDVIYSNKIADIKMFLEGAYNIENNEMTIGPEFSVPLISPYSEASDAVTVLPQNTIDWILVTLRKDTDSNNPNPETAINVLSKSAIVNKTGFIVDPHTGNKIGFNVAEDNYYIVVKHRNHLDIMSAAKIHLKK